LYPTSLATDRIGFPVILLLDSDFYSSTWRDGAVCKYSWIDPSPHLVPASGTLLWRDFHFTFCSSIEKENFVNFLGPERENVRVILQICESLHVYIWDVARFEMPTAVLMKIW